MDRYTFSDQIKKLNRQTQATRLINIKTDEHFIISNLGICSCHYWRIYHIGGSALGSPKESTEETGRKAAHDLLEAIECGGCVDKYVQVSDSEFFFNGLKGLDLV